MSDTFLQLRTVIQGHCHSCCYTIQCYHNCRVDSILGYTREMAPLVGGIKTHAKPMAKPVAKPMANLSDGRTSVVRTDKICRTDGHNLSDGRTHSNAPEKTLYIRKTFLFMLRSAPKLFYYHQLGERIPKMGFDLKSVHGKGRN